MTCPVIVLDTVSAMYLYEGIIGDLKIRIADPGQWQEVLSSTWPGAEVQIGIEDSEAAFTGIVVELDEATSEIRVVV
jgi:hypothetical protein